MEDRVGHNPPTRVNPPPLLNIKRGGDEWKLFKPMWQNYSSIAKIDSQTDEYQHALFLHTVGPEALTLYNGMHIPDPHTLKDIIDGFDAHFVGKTNDTYEHYVFNSWNQGTAEPIEDYIAALRTLSKTCNFCDCMRDSLVRDRIVLGITDNATRKRLLQETALNLATSSQLRSIGCEEMSAHAVSSRSPGGKLKPKCKFCGKNHPFKKKLSPAWGKMCKICKKNSHFDEKCKKVHLKKLLGYWLQFWITSISDWQTKAKGN